MPHFSSLVGDDETSFSLNIGDPVAPIVGNTENGGAVHDESTGKALWAVYHNSKVRCFRTVGPAITLATENDSVEEISVILDRPLSNRRSVSLSLIDGTVYATVTGNNHTDDWAGTRIFRDTGGGGVGPWVHHATLTNVAPSAAANPSGGSIFGHFYGSEILVLPWSGRWIVSAARPSVVNYDGTQTLKFDMENLYSDDEGGTWSTSVYVHQGGVGFDDNSPTDYRSVSIRGGPTSFGIYDGQVYCAIQNNTGQQIHLRSSDGALWTRYSIGGQNGNTVFKHNMSVGTNIWRMDDGAVYFTSGAPESNPSYTLAGNSGLDEDGRHQITACNIGPSRAPVAVATSFGLVSLIGYVPGTGWTVGYLGMA